MKHIHPVGSNEHPPVEPCCLGVDICNFYDIAECPVADWCYVDKESSCVLPADWCDPVDEQFCGQELFGPIQNKMGTNTKISCLGGVMPLLQGLVGLAFILALYLAPFLILFFIIRLFLRRKQECHANNMSRALASGIRSPTVRHMKVIGRASLFNPGRHPQRLSKRILSAKQSSV